MIICIGRWHYLQALDRLSSLPDDQATLVPWDEHLGGDGVPARGAVLSTTSTAHIAVVALDDLHDELLGFPEGSEEGVCKLRLEDRMSYSMAGRVPWIVHWLNFINLMLSNL